MFWAATLMPVSLTFATHTSRAVNGTHSTTSAGRSCSGGSRSANRSTYESASARVPHSFQLAAMYGLRIVEHLDPGQVAPLEQLESGASASGQVGDPVGQAELGQRGCGVAASDHCGARRL